MKTNACTILTRRNLHSLRAYSCCFTNFALQMCTSNQTNSNVTIFTERFFYHDFVNDTHLFLKKIVQVAKQKYHSQSYMFSSQEISLVYFCRNDDCHLLTLKGLKAFIRIKMVKKINHPTWGSNPRP